MAFWKCNVLMLDAVQKSLIPKINPKTPYNSPMNQQTAKKTVLRMQNINKTFKENDSNKIAYSKIYNKITVQCLQLCVYHLNHSLCTLFIVLLFF